MCDFFYANLRLSYTIWCSVMRPASLLFRFPLTSEQYRILNAAIGGHNLLITGQGGTGKSTLVLAIYNSLQNNGNKVEVICASGIATTVYDNTKIRPSTAHAFYGLRTADLPCNLVVYRAVANNLVAELFGVKRL